MSKVLAPCLELFGRPADILAELDKGISKAVWVEIRQASPGEGAAEYRANGRRAAPVIPLEPRHFKLAIHPRRNARCWEKRVVISPELFFPKIGHPLHHNLANFIAHWKEKSVESLAELSFYLPRILNHVVSDQVDML
jgi:hypothetical protein